MPKCSLCDADVGHRDCLARAGKCHKCNNAVDYAKVAELIRKSPEIASEYAQEISEALLGYVAMSKVIYHVEVWHDKEHEGENEHCEYDYCRATDEARRWFTKQSSLSMLQTKIEELSAENELLRQRGNQYIGKIDDLSMKIATLEDENGDAHLQARLEEMTDNYNRLRKLHNKTYDEFQERMDKIQNAIDE